MTRRAIVLVAFTIPVVLLLSLAVFPGAQQAGTAFLFDEDDGGWRALAAPVGGPVTVALDTGEGRRALKVSYLVERNRLSGVMRGVDGIAGTRIRIVVRADAAMLLVVGAVERDGSMYQQILQIEPGDWKAHRIDIAALALSDSSKDEDGRLTPAEVGTLVLADPHGFMGGAGERRSWHIDDYVFESGADAAAGDEHEYEPLVATGMPAPSGSRATVGVTFEAGRFGQGVVTDGAGEKVIVPAAGLRAEAGTIELWVAARFDVRAARDFTGIVAIHAEPFAAGFDGSALLFFTGSARVAFMVNAAQDEVVATPPLEWKAGEWHHVAASWGARGRRLYVDGRLVANRPLRSGPRRIARAAVIGNQAWTVGSHRYADAVIDELRLSSVQRDDADVARAAAASDPLAADAATVALERFDGLPAPPMTLDEPLVRRPAGAPVDLRVTTARSVPERARIAYTLARADGVVAHEGSVEAAASDEGRSTLRIPAQRQPGFYRIEMKLIAGGTAIDRGEGWLHLHRPEPRGADRSTFFGISGSYVEPEVHPAFFRRAAELGAATVRMPFEWAAIEPADDEFQWETYDRIVAAAGAAGVELVPTLIWERPQPAWAGPGVEGVGLGEQRRPPTNLAHWSDFVHRVVGRYKDSIRWWIPANEPNVSRYWYPRPDAGEYLALLRATRDAARKADPGARIVGGSLAGADLPFLRALFKRGGLDAMDAVGIHYYVAPHDPDDASPSNAFDPSSTKLRFRDGLDAVRSLIRQHGGTQPIWLDEAGQPYRDDFVLPGWGVSEEDAASHLVKILAESLAARGVERVLWFTLWGGEYGSFALLRPDGSPTLPYVAYAELAQRLGHARFVDATEKSGVRALCFGTPAGATRLLWSTDGAQRIELEAGGAAYNLFGFPVDDAVSAGNLRLSENPVYVESASCD